MYKLRKLKIELTQECPLACVHCSTNSNRKQLSHLPLDIVIKVLSEAALLGVERVAFTGGEPLVYSGLRQVVGFAHDKGMHISIYTCGIKDNSLRSLTTVDAEGLKESGVDRFIFSLHGPEKALHESITSFPTFDASVSAINSAIKANVPTEIHFVPMRNNLWGIEKLVVKASEWGVAQVSLLRFVSQGRGRNLACSQELLPSELRELKEIINDCRTRYPSLALRVGAPFNILLDGPPVPCSAGDNIIVINHRGEAIPCDGFKNAPAQGGNHSSVFNSTLGEIWSNSSFISRTRAAHAEGHGELCESCEHYQACLSGCLAQKVIKNGWDDIRGPDSGCLVKKREVSETVTFVADCFDCEGVMVT